MCITFKLPAGDHNVQTFLYARDTHRDLPERSPGDLITLHMYMFVSFRPPREDLFESI
jgi:hypothetical protein